MNTEKILVTGATGNTGRATIKKLIELGIPTRAMVRVLDERSQDLQKQGVEIVQGDFLNYASLQRALKDVTGAYFCFPFKDGLPKAASYFAKAAKENQVKYIVAMSQMNVHEHTSSPATQNHWITEEIFNWSGIATAHIRPGLFAWNYLNMAAPTVKAQGKFYFPNPEARFNIIHPQDIGDVVAALLTQGKIKQRNQIYELAGPNTYTNQELVQSLSEVINRSVEYVPITVEQWIGSMKQNPYLNDFLIKHLEEFSQDIKNGFFNKTNHHVLEITGHAPRSFRDFVQENIQAFV